MHIATKVALGGIAAAMIALAAGQADAAMIYLDPARATYGPGDIFLVDVRLDNEGQCVNAIETEIAVPPTLLSMVDVSRGTSILSLWVEAPTIDRLRGTVSFSGGIPAGYCGRIEGDPALSNTLATLILQVPLTAVRSAPRTAAITLSNDTKVLLNDGQGTRARLSLQHAAISIDPSLQNPTNEWKGRLDEDTIPPESFQIRVEQDPNIFDGNFFLVFSTTDKQSGLDYFEVREGARVKRAESPYELARSERGVVEVRAYDKAGNVRVETVDVGAALKAPLGLSGSSASTVTGFGLGLGIAFGLYYLFARSRHFKDEGPGTPPSTA